MGRNPKTGIPAPIPPHRVVVFKPSATLRKAVNAGDVISD
jgi:nucleoid DNA-binding protein